MSSLFSKEALSTVAFTLIGLALIGEAIDSVIDIGEVVPGLEVSGINAIIVAAGGGIASMTVGLVSSQLMGKK